MRHCCLDFKGLFAIKIINPQDISIIYVDPTEYGVRTITIPLDEDGDFKVSW